MKRLALETALVEILGRLKGIRHGRPKQGLSEQIQEIARKALAEQVVKDTLHQIKRQQFS